MCTPLLQPTPSNLSQLLISFLTSCLLLPSFFPSLQTSSPSSLPPSNLTFSYFEESLYHIKCPGTLPFSVFPLLFNNIPSALNVSVLKILTRDQNSMVYWSFNFEQLCLSVKMPVCWEKKRVLWWRGKNNTYLRI